jgi:hypothetical protein
MNENAYIAVCEAVTSMMSSALNIAVFTVSSVLSAKNEMPVTGITPGFLCSMAKRSMES